ncbi:ATP-binding protein [Paraburkholderia sp. UCT31]|uniref:ATP-binding protein n=1 Tax=Paraburkholderia sp. UCT31 TaxID=2615209 RepID=UPI001654C664|nr:ATP-binding protein [Paraburkholderia sp. UCT31]MBC8739824.1 ATP-binding protein [Paraburkholderia sp. UCT31]
MLTIRAKEREAVLQSLRAGVVPRSGQYLVQVGRHKEIEALVADVDRIADGGSSFRVVVGEYGAGKTFFLNQVRAVALEKKLVAAYADLNPDRRLQASGGQARSLYSELMKNLATRSRPEGGGLSAVVEKFITNVLEEAQETGEKPENVIARKCAHLTEMVNGYDFASVITAYWRGYDQGNEQLKLDAVRWLRGEFSTRTDARAALGVRNIVEDAHLYDQLKLMAAFVRLAGYSGLLVGLDEMVNLYKLANTQARNANYEQVLRILNDVHQGSVEGLGFILGCTPDSLLDTRRGIYSYQALQSRLAENSFAKNGMVDYNHPVLRLTALTPEDFYMLLEKIRHVYASGDASKYLLPDEGIAAFMEHCAKRIGEAYFRTPRTTITAYVNLLSVLEQYPDTSWQSMLDKVEVVKDEGGAADLVVESATATEGSDEFAEFKL